MKKVNRNKSRMKKLQGKLRQKSSKGNYYYRLTIANGVRKEFALKTADETEAIQRAEELDSIYAAPNIDVAVAQINAIKDGFVRLLYPDSPRHPRQKYLLTAKGLTVYQELKIRK